MDFDPRCSDSEFSKLRIRLISGCVHKAGMRRELLHIYSRKSSNLSKMLT